MYQLHKRKYAFFPCNSLTENSDVNSSFKRNLRNLLHIFKNPDSDIIKFEIPDNNDPIINCKDLDISEYSFTDKHNHLSFFHQSICSFAWS